MPHVNILVHEDCGWRFCLYNSTICEIIVRTSSVPFWTKHVRKYVFVCVRMMEWWRVCIYKQLLVLVEMKRIGKAEGHRQPLPTHSQPHTHTHFSHLTQGATSWFEVQSCLVALWVAAVPQLQHGSKISGEHVTEKPWVITEIQSLSAAQQHVALLRNELWRDKRGVRKAAVKLHQFYQEENAQYWWL